HRARPRVLGDLGLLGGGDVDDDAALQHLGQAGLHTQGAGLAFHGSPSLSRPHSEFTAGARPSGRDRRPLGGFTSPGGAGSGPRSVGGSRTSVPSARSSHRGSATAARATG